MKKFKILFILRKRSSYGISFGLLVSCQKIKEALDLYSNIETKIVEVLDTTKIDAEIFKFKPDYIILEAIWAEPARLPVLFKMYPDIHWTVRIHSRTNFLANEGTAIQNIKDYYELHKKHHKFTISANHFEMVDELEAIGIKCNYLPNIYLFDDCRIQKIDSNPRVLDFSSFGVLRLQKNTLIQAMAAIAFADLLDKKLNFHINSDRLELKGDSVLSNLRALFKGSKHDLVEHPWTNHDEFIELVKKMDICMAVSSTESFCLCIADSVSVGCPVIVSDVIEWIAEEFHADGNRISSIINKLELVYFGRQNFIHFKNKLRLARHNEMAMDTWLRYLRLR